MIVRYPELQSGFVAYPSEHGVQKPTAPVLTPVAMVLQPKLSRTNQDYFFSAEVELLVKELINNPLKMRELDFQAQVFQVCGVLFDRKGIYGFLRIQEEGRHISMEHRLFLQDTLGAVLMGRPRLHEPAQWATMISVSNDPMIKPFKAGAVTEAVGCRPPDDLTDFLTTWVTVLGMSDLIMSLQVLFGRRTLHASQGAARY